MLWFLDANNFGNLQIDLVEKLCIACRQEGVSAAQVVRLTRLSAVALHLYMS